jgi:hypothetical protein
MAGPPVSAPGNVRLKLVPDEPYSVSGQHRLQASAAAMESVGIMMSRPRTWTGSIQRACSQRRGRIPAPGHSSHIGVRGCNEQAVAARGGRISFATAGLQGGALIRSNHHPPASRQQSATRTRPHGCRTPARHHGQAPPRGRLRRGPACCSRRHCRRSTTTSGGQTACFPGSPRAGWCTTHH